MWIGCLGPRMFWGTRAMNFSIYTTKMKGAGPQILGTGAKFKRVPCLKSCRVNRALIVLLIICLFVGLHYFWCSSAPVFRCSGVPVFRWSGVLNFTTCRNLRTVEINNIVCPPKGVAFHDILRQKTVKAKLLQRVISRLLEPSFTPLKVRVFQP